jgi:hypothetical protein
VRGRDYEYQGPLSEFAQRFVYAGRGVGPFTHDDPETRPPEIYGGKVTIHTGPPHPSYLLLPVIPSTPTGPGGPPPPRRGEG